MNTIIDAFAVLALAPIVIGFCMVTYRCKPNLPLGHYRRIMLKPTLSVFTALIAASTVLMGLFYQCQYYFIQNVKKELPSLSLDLSGNLSLDLSGNNTSQNMYPKFTHHKQKVSENIFVILIGLGYITFLSLTTIFFNWLQLGPLLQRIRVLEDKLNQLDTEIGYGRTNIGGSNTRISNTISEIVQVVGRRTPRHSLLSTTPDIQI